MNKTQMNLQDLFLNQVRKENVPVTIYLTSGVQLKGMVKGFDSFTVVMESQGKPPQLIYKHSMASIVPMKPITLGPMFGERERPHRQERLERPAQTEPAEGTEGSGEE